MKTTRRRFLLTAAAAVALAPSVALAAAKPVPVIMGDGIHDDWEGLQALVDGKPYIVAGKGFVANDNVISGGRFRISQSLDASSRTADRERLYVMYNVFHLEGAGRT